MITILNDMDGVLVWWEKQLIKRVRERYPHIKMFDLGVRTEADQEYIDNIYEMEEIQSVLTEPGYYRHLEPIEGGFAALDEMRAEGFDPAICTAPSLRNETCASDKFNYIIEYMDYSWAEDTMIMKDKTRARGAVLVDDKSSVKGKLVPEWTHIVYDQSYNRANPTLHRMMGWKDWRRAVDFALEERSRLLLG